MARKTVNVEKLRVKSNEMLADSTCSPDIRRGIINILEFVLHETGNYHEIIYLTQANVPKGQLPGVRYDGHTATDNTRIYFCHGPV